MTGKVPYKLDVRKIAPWTKPFSAVLGITVSVAVAPATPVPFAKQLNVASTAAPANRLRNSFIPSPSIGHKLRWHHACNSQSTEKDST